VCSLLLDRYIYVERERVFNLSSTSDLKQPKPISLTHICKTLIEDRSKEENQTKNVFVDLVCKSHDRSYDSYLVIMSYFKWHILSLIYL
jgi:hypothetical protein